LSIAAKTYGEQQSSEDLHYATFNALLDALTALFIFAEVMFFGVQKLWYCTIWAHMSYSMKP